MPSRKLTINHVGKYVFPSFANPALAPLHSFPVAPPKISATNSSANVSLELAPLTFPPLAMARNDTSAREECRTMWGYSAQAAGSTAGSSPARTSGNQELATNGELSGKWTAKTVKRLVEVFPDSDYANRSVWRMYFPHARYALESGFKEGAGKEKTELL
ncbi:hypothetical protein GQ44DRAFT_825021 [Phaeosphaeriaceae sp. PMI808]|nr:hypothetical protein GQ44DRAFT_825021 [Phaeosphaeriaceae sp. PMI808]